MCVCVCVCACMCVCACILTQWRRKLLETILEKMSNFTFFHNIFYAICFLKSFNPSPHMPNVGSSNSAANKGLMSKIWTNGDTIIWLSRKHYKHVTSSFSFSLNAFKSCLLLMLQNEYLWSKRLIDTFQLLSTASLNLGQSQNGVLGNRYKGK